MKNTPFVARNQVGTPGHCMVAQVFGADGRSIAEIEPTDDPAEASATCRLFAASPKLLAAAQKVIAQWYGFNGIRPALGQAIIELAGVVTEATQDRS